MNKKLARLFAGLILALIGTMAQANLLDDPGFETATGGGQTSNSDWTLTVNFPDGSDGAAQFQEAPWASYPPSDTGVWFKPYEGNQSGGGDPLADATLSQTVTAAVGGDYALTFFAKIDPNFTADIFEVILSSTGTGGTDTVDLLSVTKDGAFYQYNLNLLGVTAGDQLTVTGLMDDGTDALLNPQSAFLDEFSLTPRNSVPTPAPLALLGIGLVATMFRRKVGNSA